MLQCVIFNVRLGQCVAFIPEENKRDYSMFIDCGHDDDFHPIDHIFEYLPKHNGHIRMLGNLTLTNYDHDHFSGLPYLKDKVKINRVSFPKNLTVDDLIDIKDEVTPALQAVIDIKNVYTEDVKAEEYNPPYEKRPFYLTKDELKKAGISIETNHLSQIVFIRYGGNTICITGDLEKPSWELMLKKPEVCDLLKQTNIFFASHHGRENGYCADVFKYCNPECIIISDKEIVHGTQENMSQTYGKHVCGDGITFKSGSTINFRKVITTRSDGHILINLHPSGDVEYISLNL